MKALVKKFLDKEISRRGFMQSMAAMGFSLKAMDSVFNSVAYASEELPNEGKSFVGTGAEILLETLRAADINYIFNANSTGQYAIYEALIDRPDMKLAVQECALIGMPDEKWGEVGLMITVLEADQKTTEEALRDHCYQRLARYKVPKRFVFAAELPHSAYGKVEKVKLKEQYVNFQPTADQLTS